MSQPPDPVGYPVQHYAQPVYPARRTDGISIAALVVGLVGLCVPLLNIVAIVLGAVGLKRTSEPGVSGKGMAIAGLVLGIVGFIFVALQISIMLPALNRVRETANRAKCASNISQIGKAALLYSLESKSNLPPDLVTLMNGGSIPVDAFCCPSSRDMPGTMTFTNDTAARNSGNLSFVWVGKGLTQSSRGDLPLLIEPLSNHDGDGGNVLFCDGHTEFLRAADVQKLIADAQNAGRIGTAEVEKLRGK